MHNEDLKEKKKIGNIILLINISIIVLFFILDSFLDETKQNYVAFILGALVVSMWAIYIIKPVGEIYRMGYYLLFLVGFMFYAGSDFNIFLQMPIAICVIIISLALANSYDGIHIMFGTYMICVAYHIWVTRYMVQMSVLELFNKFLLGAICIICSCVVAHYIALSRKEQDEKIGKLAEGYTDAISENKRILSGLSRELRTPVNVINGVSEVMIRDEADDVKRASLVTINRAGSRMGSQISDLLDYTEIVSDSLSTTVNDYAILSTVTDVITEVVALGHTMRAEVIVDVDTDIPNILSGDEPKLKRAMRGVLDNAIRYTKSGGVFLKISKRDTGYGINLHIDVYDTGIGMSRQEINNVYGLIHNYERTKQHISKGLGFGLVVVHGLVEAMDGFMTIKSEEDVGTHVSLCVPQKVRDYRPAVVLGNAHSYSISCYLNREKYEDPRVADYYTELFENLRDKLDLDVFVTDSFDELKKHVESHMATHVFVSMWEYVMDKQYYTRLSKSCDVCVFVNDEDVSDVAPTINIMRAPVYVLSILNTLSARDFSVSELLVSEAMPDYDGNIRALVVDDEKMNIIVAKEVLASYGIETVGVTSGAEAIDKCNLSDFDIIFVDYMMPDMDGIETLDNIRKLRNGSFARVPIVALTATAVSGAREMFIKSGFDDFVPKPIEIRLMSRVLRKLLSRGRN